MTELVQVAIAGDVAEAELLQEMLVDAGISAALAPSEDEVGTDSEHVRVLVPAGDVETARDAIEAYSEQDADELTE